MKTKLEIDYNKIEQLIKFIEFLDFARIPSKDLSKLYKKFGKYFPKLKLRYQLENDFTQRAPGNIIDFYRYPNLAIIEFKKGVPVDALFVWKVYQLHFK